MNKNILKSLIVKIAVLGALGPAAAHAIPTPKKQQTLQEFARRAPSGNLQAADFHAIVALSDCSGSVVKFTNSQAADKAMILTNGHCYEGGMPSNGKVIVNTPSTRSFALLNNSGSKYATLKAERVMISTMTKTDITLYLLTETYQQLFDKYKVVPLTISERHPSEKTPIAVVSGYWKRIYTCQIDGFVYALKEANWTMSDSIRYSSSGCEIIGGTSGSPVINLDNYEVTGVNNTTNESGGRCTMNNPCEIDATGKITVIKNASYGQEVHVLYSCLDQQRQINLNMPGCALRPLN